VERSRIARERIYSQFPGVRVPMEQLLHRRLVMAEFADGVSFKELPPGAQRETAERILSMERQILFADRGEIEFDPDRHAGNFRILQQPDGSILIQPIDFGQVLSITRAQRDALIDLFAAAQVFQQAGPVRSLMEPLAARLGLAPALLGRVMRALRRYFPDSGLKPVTAYYAVLSALEDAGAPQPIVYFDFVRSIMQLQQYESALPQGSAALGETPKAELERLVTARARAMAADLRLTWWEKVGFVIDRSWDGAVSLCQRMLSAGEGR
jgi:hypothetical protein